MISSEWDKPLCEVGAKTLLWLFLMFLLVSPWSEEQVIPYRADLLEQVKNLQPILDSASIQGTPVRLQV